VLFHHWSSDAGKRFPRRSRPREETTMAHWFTRFAHRAATLAGHHLTFFAALALIAGWGLTGPFFGFSETWQLIINTGTTIVTFLMVFLIQNTQNRDALAMQLKLDEIIRAVEGADNAFIRAEEETTEDLEDLKLRYEALYAAHTKLKAKLEIDEANGARDGVRSAAEASVHRGGAGADRAHEPSLPSPARSSKSEMTATFAADADSGSNS
jgi:low affinity Fe/Cu permease